MVNTPKFQVGNLVGNIQGGWNRAVLLWVYKVTNVKPLVVENTTYYKYTVKPLQVFEKGGNNFNMKGEDVEQSEFDFVEIDIEPVQDIIYKFIEYFEKRKEFFSKISEKLSQREMATTTTKP
jgi:Cu2+-containing amine oxidase